MNGRDSIRAGKIGRSNPILTQVGRVEVFLEFPCHLDDGVWFCIGLTINYCSHIFHITQVIVSRSPRATHFVKDLLTKTVEDVRMLWKHIDDESQGSCSLERAALTSEWCRSERGSYCITPSNHNIKNFVPDDDGVWKEIYLYQLR